MDANLEKRNEKRHLIARWEASAIGLQEAEDRHLVRISSPTCWRNWSCREALFDFAQKSAHASPVLVRLDTRRVALFSAPRTPLKHSRGRRKATGPGSPPPSAPPSPGSPLANPWSGSAL